MKVRVLYFGELRETVGKADELVAVGNDATVAGLIDELVARGQPWQTALTSTEPLRVAVNQEMASLQTALCLDAEVALFRPVTGG
jgi:molybdopterin synthase sulfur carrier subunit